MYIAIEGVIGVGKTTLARLLQPIFEVGAAAGSLRGEPFPLRFLLRPGSAMPSRPRSSSCSAATISSAAPWPRSLAQRHQLIADYTFEKDALFARINLHGDELEMYYRVHEALAEKIILPDLIVYLRADTDMLMQRIAQRDRPYERNMERDYIDELNQAYEDFFSRAGSQSARRCWCWTPTIWITCGRRKT